MEHNTIEYNALECDKSHNINQKYIVDIVSNIKFKIKDIENNTDGSHLFEFIKLIEEFIIRYQVSEFTKHYMFDIIDTIWNIDRIGDNKIDYGYVSYDDHLRRLNQFKRCIIGMMVRTVTDIYKSDSSKYKQDQMFIMVYIFGKIMHYNDGSECTNNIGSINRLHEINKYLI